MFYRSFINTYITIFHTPLINNINTCSILIYWTSQCEDRFNHLFKSWIYLIYLLMKTILKISHVENVFRFAKTHHIKLSVSIDLSHSLCLLNLNYTSIGYGLCSSIDIIYRIHWHYQSWNVWLSQLKLDILYMPAIDSHIICMFQFPDSLEKSIMANIIYSISLRNGKEYSWIINPVYRKLDGIKGVPNWI